MKNNIIILLSKKKYKENKKEWRKINKERNKEKTK